MKRPGKRFIFSAMLLLIGVACLHAEDYKRNYIKGGKLTLRQERIVVELANESGINDIEEIYTNYIYPSAEKFIGVRERKTRIGNKTTRRILSIYYKPWCRKCFREAEKGYFTKGAFRTGNIWEDVRTIFQINGTEYPLILYGNISENIARQILVTLLEGKIVFKGEDLDLSDLENIAIKSPVGLGPSYFDEKSEYTLGYKHINDDACSGELGIQYIDEEIVVRSFGWLCF